jgi:hypothetical protein
MKYIKTYEGIFDFFKKVDLDKMYVECRKILSGKEGLKESKVDRGFEWNFSDNLDGSKLIYNVKLTKREEGVFLIYVGCEDSEDSDINDYISIMKDGKEFLVGGQTGHKSDLAFHINYHISNLGKKVRHLIKSKEFFAEHPKDEIEDYIIDLKDTLGDDITLDKDYQRCGWQMQFHISRDSNNFDSVKNEIDEQVRVLSSLLDSVNLQLVDLKQKLDSGRKMSSGQKYGHYRFLIKKK